MIKNKKVLGLIPARGGSKGLPGKNIKELSGKPLIAWTIDAAKKSKYIDKVILSSDDSEIIEVAANWGAEIPFVRPASLAMDKSTGMDVILHALEAVAGYDILVYLQPTSPFRASIDIDNCLEMLAEDKCLSVVSVTEPDKSPFWMYQISESGHLNPFFKDYSAYQRQQLPKTYVINGAVYVADIKWVQADKSLIYEKTLGYIMPKERSIDIDTELDFNLAELMIKNSVTMK